MQTILKKQNLSEDLIIKTSKEIFKKARELYNDIHKRELPQEKDEIQREENKNFLLPITVKKEAPNYTPDAMYVTHFINLPAIVKEEVSTETGDKNTAGTSLQDFMKKIKDSVSFKLNGKDEFSKFIQKMFDNLRGKYQENSEEITNSLQEVNASQ